MDLQKAGPKWQVVLFRSFNPIGARKSRFIDEDFHGIPNNLMLYITQIVIGMRKEIGVF